MKTVRQHTFETNSSSTHAYSVDTLNESNRIDLNIIPDENGEIVLFPSTMDESNTPQSKISHMLAYARAIKDQELFERIVETVNEHTGGKLVVKDRVWRDKNYHHDIIEKIEGPKLDLAAILAADEDDDAFEDDRECLRDTFYSYTCEYGHGSLEDFVEVHEAIASSKATLGIFFFSSKQGVNVASYYN